MNRLFFLVTFLISTFFRCINPDDCSTDFHLPAEVIPYQREYHIGDTITIQSKFHYLVYDDNTKLKFDMRNIIWSPNGVIYYLDTLGEIKSIRLEFFDLILPSNYFIDSSSFGYSILEGQYVFENDSFLLKYSIIPKRTGNYLMSLISGVAPGHNQQRFPGDCGRGFGYNVWVDMNPGKDGNKEILKLAKDSLFSDQWYNSPTHFGIRGGFCFTVLP